VAAIPWEGVHDDSTDHRRGESLNGETLSATILGAGA
jgi:hypothetical protein